MTDCLQLAKERELDWAEWRSCEPKELVETVFVVCKGKVARDVDDVAMAVVLPVPGVGEH